MAEVLLEVHGVGSRGWLLIGDAAMSQMVVSVPPAAPPNNPAALASEGSAVIEGSKQNK